MKHIERHYREYGGMVFRRCRHLLKDDDLAYDALQEIFINLMKKYKSSFEENMPSLLYRMATNHCINVIKKNTRTRIDFYDEMVHEIAAKENMEMDLIHRETLTEIFSRELSRGYQKSVDTETMAVMYFLDDLTYKEIAIELEMSVSGVRKRLEQFKKEILKFKEEYLG